VDVFAMLICCCIIGCYEVKISITGFPSIIFQKKNTGNQQPGGGYDHIKIKFKGEVMFSRKIKNV
jgi:hypothetical protein